jgi:small subunit ribosomal protein S4
MSKYRGPRLRLVRKLGDLPGLTRKVSNKPNTSGQHGQLRSKLVRNMSPH